MSATYPSLFNSLTKPLINKLSNLTVKAGFLNRSTLS